MGMEFQGVPVVRLKRLQNCRRGCKTDVINGGQYDIDGSYEGFGHAGLRIPWSWCWT